MSLTTLGTGSQVIDWEYYNGTSWADLTETDTDTGASKFTASGTFTWTMPSGWTKTTVNSSDSLYFIRGKLTTGYTIAPIVNAIALYDVVSEQVHLRDVTYENWGKLTYLNGEFPNGSKNIRIDYSYGETTTPALISELSALMVGIRAYVNITGGSFDNATSFTVGSKAVTVGEQYVNIREVLDQFKKRVEEILRSYGGRADVSVI